jgi:predicted amidohydrolase YtcJ
MNDGSIALVNGQVRTFDRSDSVAEAIYVDRGVIVAIGSTESVRARVPDDVPVVDLEGRMALPGLIDAHAHVELSTLADHFWVVVRELDVPTTLQRLGEAVRRAAPGAWIVGQGTFGQELPTRAQLDHIAPENPVVVRQSMHKQVANSLALTRAGIDRSFVSGVEARVLRGADGEPTGAIEEGFDLFPVPRPSEEALARALAAEVRDGWVRHGITTVHELPASSAGTRAWQRLSAADALPCRIVVNPILAPGHQPTVDSVDSFANLGFMTGFGDRWLRLGSLKLFLDGVGCAGLYYAQFSGEARDWGLQTFLFQDLVRILARAREARVHVWMHAKGDAAHSMAMDAIEAVNVARGNGDHRTRIEHLGLVKADDGSQFARLREIGATPVPTPAFMHFEPDDREANLPEGALLYPYKSLIAAGLRPPGNSDSAGTQPFATNPWHGISLMYRRVNKRGIPFSREEAVDVVTAFRTYTANGAYVGFDEKLKGSLEVGKLGDVAVFADDPFALDIERLPNLEADLTVVGGRVLHDRATAPPRASGPAPAIPVRQTAAV